MKDFEEFITCVRVFLKRGRLLFSRDEKVRVEVVDEAVREYADLRMLRSICESGE